MTRNQVSAVFTSGYTLDKALKQIPQSAERCREKSNQNGGSKTQCVGFLGEKVNQPNQKGTEEGA